MNHTIEEHAALIDQYAEARAALRNATQLEMKLEAERASVKQAAIVRLVGTENPATPGKSMSFTAAESAASTDPGYRAHLALQASAVGAKMDAATVVETIRMRIDLSLHLLTATVEAA